MASSSFSAMTKSEQPAYRCSVCLGNFDNPKVISCGHTFCQNCLQQLPTTRRRYKTTFRCPECRCEVELPSSGRVEDFPTNFAIKGAIELSVNGYALQSLCVKHEKNQELFCNTCSTCICADCFVQKHKLEAHDVTSTSDQANETVEQLRSAEECYKQSQFTRLFDKISNMEDSNAENGRAVVRRINEVREQMIKEIERQADQLVKVVEVVTEDKKQELGRMKKSIEKKYNENLEKAKQCSSLVDEISKFGLSQERFEKGRDLCIIQEKDDMVNNRNEVLKDSDDEDRDSHEIQEYDDYYESDDDKPTYDIPQSNDDKVEYSDNEKGTIDDEFVSSSFHQLEQFNSTLEFQENFENNYIVVGLVKQSKSKLIE